MQFQREIGAVVSTDGHILSMVKGTAGEVVFPQQQVWDIHKASPGHVHALIHTHPPNMTNLSAEDISTLKAWSLGLSPFPIRMGVITTEGKNTNPKLYIYRGDLQLKEFWIPGTERKFEALREYTPKFINKKLIKYLWAWSCTND